MITSLGLARVMRRRADCLRRSMEWTPHINDAMARWGISTPARMYAFIAQVLHECAEFTAMRENLNYSAEALVRTWPTRFRHRLPGEDIGLVQGSDGKGIAESYARNPYRIACRVYADRLGNGDEASGDGFTYRGGGGIQLTGKANYRAASIAVAGDADTLLLNPELIETPAYAMQTAGWFWHMRGLNAYADRGDIDGCTRRINGGRHGAEERRSYYNQLMANTQGDNDGQAGPRQ